MHSCWIVHACIMSAGALMTWFYWSLLGSQTFFSLTSGSSRVRVGNRSALFQLTWFRVSINQEMFVSINTKYHLSVFKISKQNYKYQNLESLLFHGSQKKSKDDVDCKEFFFHLNQPFMVYMIKTRIKSRLMEKLLMLVKMWVKEHNINLVKW